MGYYILFNQAMGVVVVFDIYIRLYVKMRRNALGQ